MTQTLSILLTLTTTESSIKTTAFITGNIFHKLHPVRLYFYLTALDSTNGRLKTSISSLTTDQISTSNVIYVRTSEREIDFRLLAVNQRIIQPTNMLVDGEQSTIVVTRMLNYCD